MTLDQAVAAALRGGPVAFGALLERVWRLCPEASACDVDAAARRYEVPESQPGAIVYALQPGVGQLALPI